MKKVLLSSLVFVIALPLFSMDEAGPADAPGERTPYVVEEPGEIPVGGARQEASIVNHVRKLGDSLRSIESFLANQAATLAQASNALAAHERALVLKEGIKKWLAQSGSASDVQVLVALARELGVENVVDGEKVKNIALKISTQILKLEAKMSRDAMVLRAKKDALQDAAEDAGLDVQAGPAEHVGLRVDVIAVQPARSCGFLCNAYVKVIGVVLSLTAGFVTAIQKEQPRPVADNVDVAALEAPEYSQHSTDLTYIVMRGIGDL